MAPVNLMPERRHITRAHYIGDGENNGQSGALGARIPIEIDARGLQY
jgi:hypothetical protein